MNNLESIKSKLQSYKSKDPTKSSQFPKELKSEILSLSDHYSINEISKLLSIPPTTIYGWSWKSKQKKQPSRQMMVKKEPSKQLDLIPIKPISFEKIEPTPRILEFEAQGSGGSIKFRFSNDQQELVSLFFKSIMSH